MHGRRKLIWKMIIIFGSFLLLPICRRTTSRVLAPSGGQSSLTFGLRPAPEVKPMPTPPAPETTEISTGTCSGRFLFVNMMQYQHLFHAI
jgi:hypothetical protein